MKNPNLIAGWELAVPPFQETYIPVCSWTSLDENWLTPDHLDQYLLRYILKHNWVSQTKMGDDGYSSWAIIHLVLTGALTPWWILDTYKKD